MPEFRLLVFTDPVEGREEEYNDWYDNQHVPDALTFPGFKSAQRFRTGPGYLGKEPPCRYATIYEIEADTIEDAIRASEEGTARTFVTDAIDRGTDWVIPLTPLGPVRRRS
jgi:hypothetical protein